MQPHRRAFVSPPSFRGPHSRAMPHSANSTMGLYAAKATLPPTSYHHTSLRRGTGIHRGHQGTKMPTLSMPCAVHLSFTTSDIIREDSHALVWAVLWVVPNVSVGYCFLIQTQNTWHHKLTSHIHLGLTRASEISYLYINMFDAFTVKPVALAISVKKINKKTKKLYFDKISSV